MTDTRAPDVPAGAAAMVMNSSGWRSTFVLRNMARDAWSGSWRSDPSVTGMPSTPRMMYQYTDCDEHVAGAWIVVRMDFWNGIRMVEYTPPVCAVLPNSSCPNGDPSAGALLPTAPRCPTWATSRSDTSMLGAVAPSMYTRNRPFSQSQGHPDPG
jgi:hypothetical protein